MYRPTGKPSLDGRLALGDVRMAADELERALAYAVEVDYIERDLSRLVNRLMALGLALNGAAGAISKKRPVTVRQLRAIRVARRSSGKK